MGSIQSSSSQHSHQQYVVDRPPNTEDIKNLQSYEAYLSRNGISEHIMLYEYNEWLKRKNLDPLNVGKFKAVIKAKAELDTKNKIDTEAKAKAAAEAKAAKVAKEIEKINAEKTNLETNSIVYCSGHSSGQSQYKKIKLHCYSQDLAKYAELNFDKWSDFRLIDFKPFRDTEAHRTKPSKCFVQIRQLHHPQRANIVLTWEQFIINFTPFSEKESGPNKPGNAFNSSNWHFNDEYIRASADPFSKSQEQRRQQQPRQTYLENSQYGDPDE
jgi:hypothetical protein